MAKDAVFVQLKNDRAVIVPFADEKTATETFEVERYHVGDESSPRVHLGDVTIVNAEIVYMWLTDKEEKTRIVSAFADDEHPNT